jgi:hypothetical protein
MEQFELSRGSPLTNTRVHFIKRKIWVKQLISQVIPYNRQKHFCPAYLNGADEFRSRREAETIRYKLIYILASVENRRVAQLDLGLKAFVKSSATLLDRICDPQYFCDTANQLWPGLEPLGSWGCRTWKGKWDNEKSRRLPQLYERK